MLGLSAGPQLVAVRRRDGPVLSKVSVAQAVAPGPSAVVLQALLAELASLRQQVNSLVLARPASLPPTGIQSREGGAAPAERVKPSRLRSIFD